MHSNHARVVPLPLLPLLLLLLPPFFVVGQGASVLAVSNVLYNYNQIKKSYPHSAAFPYIVYCSMSHLIHSHNNLCNINTREYMGIHGNRDEEMMVQCVFAKGYFCEWKMSAMCVCMCVFVCS